MRICLEKRIFPPFVHSVHKVCRLFYYRFEHCTCWNIDAAACLIVLHHSLIPIYVDIIPVNSYYANYFYVCSLLPKRAFFMYRTSFQINVTEYDSGTSIQHGSAICHGDGSAVWHPDGRRESYGAVSEADGGSRTMPPTVVRRDDAFC